MARAQNKVIAGDYNGREVNGSFGSITLYGGRSVNSIFINKETVEAYELVTDEHRKSAASGAARGLVGGALLGPVGALAGGLSATNKGVYLVAVQFKDGKKSLLEVNDKLYKLIVTNCFAYSSSGSSSSGASASEKKTSSNNDPKAVQIDDFAIGVNSLESPMPGYEPRYIVNMNNRKLAEKAVSAIDAYFKNNIDEDTLKSSLDEYTLNVSNEENEENKNAFSFSHYLSSITSTVNLLASEARLNRPLDRFCVLQVLITRNEVARHYIVDEKINVKNVATKILNMINDYLKDENKRNEVSGFLVVYHDTLKAYLGRTVKEGSVFNDEDVNKLTDLTWDFWQKMPSSDEPVPVEELKAIADEIESIVKSLPDAPSVDVYYKAEESPAQEPEPQEANEPESAAEASQDIAEAAPASSADEIRKYKELLDDGIITQEEFDAKKKQLMGL